MTAITPLPTAPSRSDTPSDFVTKSDAFVAALALFVTQANALAVLIDNLAGDATTAASAAAAALNASDYVASSASSLSVGTGSHAFVLDQSGKAFADDDAVVAFRRSDPLTRMVGAVSSVVGTTVTVNVTSVGGSGGPYTDWVFMSAGFQALLAAAVSTIRAGTDTTVGITPGTLYSALAEVALTDASTIAVDMATFVNATVTLGGSRTLGNPTNPKVGQGGEISVVQDGTGSRTLSFASNWKRAGGAPTLTTTAGATDIIVYKVKSSTFILYDLKKNPS